MNYDQTRQKLKKEFGMDDAQVFLAMEEAMQEGVHEFVFKGAIFAVRSQLPSAEFTISPLA